MRSIGNLLRSLFSLASVLAAVAAFLNLFFVDVIVVPHNGMAPTLIYGDRVLVWRRAHVDMGDVVVCEHPAKPEASVLGRAVAFAGHTIDADSSGSLSVDGDRASLEWQGDMRFFDQTHDKLFTMARGSIDYHRQNRHDFIIERDTAFWLRPYSVQHGAYLLGDNRSDPDDDSREFGEVDIDKCKGQVFMRLTPAAKQDDDIHHGYFDVVL
jgi:signal peptidase I